MATAEIDCVFLRLKSNWEMVLRPTCNANHLTMQPPLLHSRLQTPAEPAGFLPLEEDLRVVFYGNLGQFQNAAEGTLDTKPLTAPGVSFPDPPLYFWGHMPDTASRRALLVGLAVMPAINTTTVAASVAPDPIFAVIARHRAALAALATIDQLAEPAAYAAVDQEMFAAADVMATTVPQTVSGAKALLDVTIADAEADGEQGRWIDTLKVLRVALDRLAALSA